ncbi:hypothetical protein [Collinsella sp. zg1085]|nr:hypothetical protein [Collinsella sp. zg1085]
MSQDEAASFILKNQGTIYVDVLGEDFKTVVDKLPVEYAFADEVM